MELSYTLQTGLGMCWYGTIPHGRIRRFDDLSETWIKSKHRGALMFAIEQVLKQPSTTADGRFPVERDWKSVPALLVEALVSRQLPGLKVTDSLASRISRNLIEIVKPIDLHLVKSIIINCRRIDIEQAVALVLRLLPEHVTDLVPLVPTIITQSNMWLDDEPPSKIDTDLYRRQHLSFLLSLADVQEATDYSMESLAALLFRVRRDRPANKSRGLRLPDFIQKYYPGDPADFSWAALRDEHPSRIIPNPIVVSKANFRRLSRYIWRLIPNAPDKVLRREIQGLSQQLLYAQEAKPAISATNDHAALAYTLLSLERRLQLTIVSDLRGRFLQKGEAKLFQQNTPHIPTSLENRLAEIVLAQRTIDWPVFTAVQRPKGVDAVDSTDELLVIVDRVCTCFEEYVYIHGHGYTERLRPRRGRYGGFRGPVDDWNAAVDVLIEVRRRITDAGYQVVSNDDTLDVDNEFAIVEHASAEETTEKGMELPRVDKFLALDIMSWNGSWGDDVFALEKMPPQWWTWLQKRRAEGKCPPAVHTIIID